MCAFPDVTSAVTTSVQVLQSGIPIAKMEFLDELAMDIANKYSGLDYLTTPTLFLEFTGSAREVDDHAAVVSESWGGRVEGMGGWVGE